MLFRSVSKRPRSSTLASGGDTTGSGDASPRKSEASQPAKKRKEGDSGDPKSASESEPGGEDAVDIPTPSDDEGQGDATDGGLEAMASRVNRVGKGSRRLLTAEDKRKRFLAKYQGMTPEEILGPCSHFFWGWRPCVDLCLLADALSKTWRSSVYEHFARPRIITNGQGGVTHRFVCKR